jgi:hypothetical protein
MRLRLPPYEVPTKQDLHCDALQSVGADIAPDVDDDEETIAWGADPFDIVAHREAHGLSDDD